MHVRSTHLKRRLSRAA